MPPKVVRGAAAKVLAAKAKAKAGAKAAAGVRRRPAARARGACVGRLLVVEREQT